MLTWKKKGPRYLAYEGSDLYGFIERDSSPTVHVRLKGKGRKLLEEKVQVYLWSAFVIRGSMPDKKICSVSSLARAKIELQDWKNSG